MCGRRPRQAEPRRPRPPPRASPGGARCDGRPSMPCAVPESKGSYQRWLPGPVAQLFVRVARSGGATARRVRENELPGGALSSPPATELLQPAGGVEADRRGSLGRPVSGQLGETVRLGLARTGRPTEGRGGGSGEAFAHGVLRDQWYGAAGGEQRPTDAHTGCGSGALARGGLRSLVGRWVHAPWKQAPWTWLSRRSHSIRGAGSAAQLRFAPAATLAGRFPYIRAGKSHKKVLEDFSKKGWGEGARVAPWLRAQTSRAQGRPGAAAAPRPREAPLTWVRDGRREPQIAELLRTGEGTGGESRCSGEHRP